MHVLKLNLEKIHRLSNTFFFVQSGTFIRGHGDWFREDAVHES